MCCDGTLFTHGVLDPDELEAAREFEMIVTLRTVDSGATVSSFEQGCSRFQGGCCSRYDEWRPRVCERYRCELLKTLTAGTRTLAECLDVVQQVREVADQLPPRAERESPSSNEHKMAVAMFAVLRRKFVDGEAAAKAPPPAPPAQVVSEVGPAQ